MRTPPLVIALAVALGLVPGVAAAAPPAIGPDQLTHLDADVQEALVAEADTVQAISDELERARGDLKTLEETRSLAKVDLSEARGDLAVTRDQASAAEDVA